jgi:SOS response regulatory protein OraA/RecX
LLKKNLETKNLRNKLSAFLFSKGFDYELIKEVCEKILKTKIEE